MHQRWCDHGLPPDRFWNITPKEVSRETRAAVKRQMTERNENMVLAWHTAWLHRVEKMPKLESLLSEGKRTRLEPPSWQQQQAAMLAWIGTQRKD
jgi:hypothetical protein